MTAKRLLNGNADQGSHGGRPDCVAGDCAVTLAISSLLAWDGSAEDRAVGGGVGVLAEFGDAPVGDGPDVQVGQVEPTAAVPCPAGVGAEASDGGAEPDDLMVGERQL